MENLKTKTTMCTQYHVTYDGFHGYFSQSGYSKYYERFTAKDKGLLNEDIYGLEQAKEHIKELKEYEYMGKKPNENTQFVIEVVSTIVTSIEV